jgi:hypothetical protein
LRVGIDAKGLGDALDWKQPTRRRSPVSLLALRSGSPADEEVDALATSSPSTSSDLTLPSATDVLRKSSMFQTRAFLFWSAILKREIGLAC